MIYNQNRPNINPVDNDSLVGTIQFSFYEYMKGIQNMLPAKVIAFDRTTNRVQVQLMIKVLSTSGEQYPNAQIASIPVFQYGGGGYILSIPLKTGDLGWVLANDRDISLFLQNYEAAAPAVNLIKNFSQGVFFPDVMTGYSIADEDSDNAVLQNLSGSVKISIGSDEVTITAPTVNINGNIQSIGNMFVEGNIQATGSITPDVPPP